MNQTTTQKKSMWGLGNIHPAVLAVWAALIAVAYMLPSIPMLGTGTTFSISAALIPLAGIFFGPIPGAICVAIGAFIGQIVAPHTAWMGMLTFIFPTFEGLCAGLIVRKKWFVNIAIVVIGAVAFYFSPGRAAVFFPIVYYGLGAVLSIVGSIYVEKWLLSPKKVLKFVGLFVAALGGFCTAAAIGNIASAYVFELPASVYNVLTFMSPLERTVFSLGSSIIGLPLLIGLPKIGIYVGPQPEVTQAAPSVVDDDDDD